jgi:hypothetical protein
MGSSASSGDAGQEDREDPIAVPCEPRRALRPRGPLRHRQPTATPLHPTVQHHRETFLARASEENPLRDGLPG